MSLVMNLISRILHFNKLSQRTSFFFTVTSDGMKAIGQLKDLVSHFCCRLLDKDIFLDMVLDHLEIFS